MKTRFILIGVSHAGNVGAAARALRVMGFDDLVLVAPRWPNVLAREEAIQRASGALDVLKKARIVPTLDEALDGMTHLCATAMTPRDFGPPTHAPRPYLAERAAEPPEGMAFLFGPERYGMANEDVWRCNVCLSIPTDPSFGSLNLAAAIQVVAYEWRQALGGFALPKASVREAKAADGVQVAGLLGHLESALVDVGYLDPAAPKKLMPRLAQLFARAAVTEEEVHILRGIAKAMQQTAGGNAGENAGGNAGEAAGGNAGATSTATASGSPEAASRSDGAPSKALPEAGLAGRR